MKILVIRIDGIGDNLMNIPFLKECRRIFNNDEITLMMADEDASINDVAIVAANLNLDYVGN